ncbi:hypothetical protein [Haloarcula laminariae]|uniref:hypothetical protein n=1 Tax=Haloarcula laminariae TaxID=2961577 RepID=UPI002406A390|nr:hypothetical protein [Halomicroarcula sp. FL173]
MDTHDGEDDQFDRMVDRIETTIERFTESQYYQGLSQHQQDEAPFIIESLIELLHGYADTTLETCDSNQVETVCLDIHPTTLDADPEHFSAVGPVVAALFRFLADRGDHPNGEELAAHMESLSDDIVEAAVTGESPPPDFSIGDLTPEESQALDDAIDSLSADAKATLETVTEAAMETGLPADQEAVFESVDVTQEEYEAAMAEAVGSLEAADELSTAGDNTDATVLDTEQADRFLELYGRLLVYVNDRFDIVPEIETYTEFETAFLDEIEPIRDYFYHEANTEEIISAFVADNPADLPDSALAQIEEWINYEYGKFAVVEHREKDTVLVDPEQPRAYSVKGVYDSLSSSFPSRDLPIPVSDVVLLPFEGTIVTDGWFHPSPILQGAWEITTGTDIETTAEEARHRYGVAESLPPADESGRSDAERLRFYTKNQENRERFADEIDELKDKNEDLQRIYHKQLGKARARSLGREFRELGLDAAAVAIYDGQVIASAPTESQLHETLTEIMPEGTADHPYIYQYDP